jgi:hypothetical protein
VCAQDTQLQLEKNSEEKNLRFSKSNPTLPSPHNVKGEILINQELFYIPLICPTKKFEHLLSPTNWEIKGYR